MLKKIGLNILTCCLMATTFSGCSKSKEEVAELYLESLKTNNPDLLKGYSTLLTYVQLTEYIASSCLNHLEPFDKNVVKAQLLLRFEKEKIPTKTTDVLVNNKIIEICKNEKYFDYTPKIKDYNFISSEQIGEKYEVKYEVTLNDGEKYIKSIIIKINPKTGNFEVE